MENFTYQIATKINFGKGQISHLSELKESGTKVLLVYGGSSIKRIGLYDQILSILKENGLQVFELAGIEPNPRITSVRKGVEICKENKIDMVLGVGGGSAIDASKVIAAGALFEGDPWDLVLDSSKIIKALPIYSVLTITATGTEMDTYAVISDLEKNEKWGTGSECLRPIMSIMDPTYTFSVSKKQTAAGTADMLSHTFEEYFNSFDSAELQANFAEAVLKVIFKYGPIALNEPDNYEARANLMWASSWAINGLLDAGCSVAWCVHPIEHELSAFYDITHGEGLAILTPVWMEAALNAKTKARFARFARNVLDVEAKDDIVAAKEGIKLVKKFLFETMGLPANLRAVGITNKDNFDIMASKAAEGCKGCYVTLEKEDIVDILEKAF